MKRVNLYVRILVLLIGTYMFCGFTSSFSHAQTTSGTLAADEVWSGTITLTGDVTVPKGITLTIEPGTDVICPARSDDTAGGSITSLTELIVEGSLVVAAGESALATAVFESRQHGLSIMLDSSSNPVW